MTSPTSANTASDSPAMKLYLAAAVYRVNELSTTQRIELASELTEFDTDGIDLSKPDKLLYQLQFYPFEIFSGRKPFALKLAMCSQGTDATMVTRTNCENLYQLAKELFQHGL